MTSTNEILMRVDACFGVVDVSVSHFSLNKTYLLVNGLVSALEVGTILKQVF